MIIVTLALSLAPNVQEQRRKVTYLQACKVNAEDINLVGGYAGGNITAAKLVA